MNPSEIAIVAGALGPILLGIAVLVSLHLVAVDRDPLREDIIHLILTMTGWVLIGAGVFGNGVWMLGPLAVPWCIVAVIVFIDGMGKYRSSQQYALLWVLTISAERFMPLAPAVEAFARERGGVFGRRAKRLADMLNAGTPLPDALAKCRGLLPPGVLPLVRIGCESGALAPALRQAATVHDLNNPLWIALVGRITYLLLLPAFGLSILAFVMLKIVPSFEKIFADFGTTLPPMTQLLIFISREADKYWYVFTPMYMLGMLLILYSLGRYLGWIRWDLPGMGWITRRLDTAAILDALSLVSRQNRPLPQAIVALAWTYPKRGVRWRLWRAAALVERGADWCESLFAYGLIRRADLAILQAAQRVGNLPWAMQEMADSNRRRLAYRLMALVQVLVPPAIILLALIEMFIVLALFLPLITLIQKMV